MREAVKQSLKLIVESANFAHYTLNVLADKETQEHARRLLTVCEATEKKIREIVTNG